MTTGTALAFLGEQTNQLPTHLINNADKHLGNENVGADDQQLPRLSLLQALSPQCEEIEGAKAGLFHNSITDELYKEVTVINLYYVKEWAVWRKRNKGGGFCGAYDSVEAANAHVESLPGSPEDYDIQETAKHACLLLDPETGEVKQPIVIYFKSTGLNTSRNWNTRIQSINGDHPRFSTIWTLSAKKQSNDSGTWYSMVVDGGWWVPTEELYNEAKSFYEAMKNHF